MLIALAIAVVAHRNVVKTFCFFPDRFCLTMVTVKDCLKSNNADRSCDLPPSRPHADYLYFLLRIFHRNEVIIAPAAPEKDPSLTHEAIAKRYASTATCMTRSKSRTAVTLTVHSWRNRGGEAKRLKCGVRAKVSGDASIVHRPTFYRGILIGRSDPMTTA